MARPACCLGDLDLQRQEPARPGRARDQPVEAQQRRQGLARLAAGREGPGRRAGGLHGRVGEGVLAGEGHELAGSGAGLGQERPQPEPGKVRLGLVDGGSASLDERGQAGGGPGRAAADRLGPVACRPGELRGGEDRLVRLDGLTQGVGLQPVTLGEQVLDPLGGLQSHQADLGVERGAGLQRLGEAEPIELEQDLQQLLAGLAHGAR